MIGQPARVFSGLLLATLLTACAAAPAGRTEVGSQYVLPRAELEARPAATVYDVVSAKRPSWLQNHTVSTGVSGTGPTAPEVYVDGRRVGPLEVLRTISVSSVEKVCYFRPTHAQSRFGLTAQRAAVEVFTRGNEYARRSC